MWEVFRQMMIKVVGTMARVYNPGAEMPLKKKMGKWLRVERHIQYALIRDEAAYYERLGEGWRRYEKDTQTNQFRLQDEHNIDITQCHTIDGKVEEGKLYTHMKFNMEDIPTEVNQGKPAEVVIEEIKPEPKGTKIYSDGSAYVEEKNGECATIVNKKGKNITSSRSLHSDKANNLYRTELEGIYLGTKLAEGAGSKDTQWEYWSDSRAAITQCGKNI